MILRHEFNWFTHEKQKQINWSGLEFFEKVDAKDKTFKSWEGLYHECTQALEFTII
jgi:alpha-beta hydrolase superfamily lysophospholipase